MTQQYLTLNQPKQQNLAVVPSPSLPSAALVSSTDKPNPIGQIATTWPLKCVVKVSEVVTIPAPVYFGQYSPLAMLAGFLAIGRTYHPLCRNAFVERVQIGYYAYERHEEWRTCALAAAYAGAFGPQAIERPEFSYSQAIWQLSDLVGYDLNELHVLGPTGRVSAVCDEMVLLTDTNLWTRLGLVHWLPKAHIVQRARAMS